PASPSFWSSSISTSAGHSRTRSISWTEGWSCITGRQKTSTCRRSAGTCRFRAVAAERAACYENPMRAVLMGMLGFVIGSAGSLVTLLLGYGIFSALTDFHDFEGATAMGL